MTKMKINEVNAALLDACMPGLGQTASLNSLFWQIQTGFRKSGPLNISSSPNTNHIWRFFKKHFQNKASLFSVTSEHQTDCE